MNKKIKLLFRLNFVSYVAIFLIYYLIKNGNFNDLNNISKFILVSIALLVISLTSFILADDANKELKCIKSIAKFDFGIRLIAYITTLYEVKSFSNNWHLGLIVILFIVNCIIEYKMNIKLNNIEKIELNKKIQVSYEEKCNLNNMMKSVNLAMFSWFVFCMICLNVSTLKNMVGAEESGIIPVIISIALAAWFVKINYKNYIRFYLDKGYAKKIFIRDISFAILGYFICLIVSFIKFGHEIHMYIIIVGLIFIMPMINTIRNMSLRLNQIRSAIGKEEYNEFIIKNK